MNKSIARCTVCGCYRPQRNQRVCRMSCRNKDKTWLLRQRDSKRTGRVLSCPVCNKPHYRKLSEIRKGIRCCSKRCAYQSENYRTNRLAEKHPSWKGGRTHSGGGYILVRVRPNSKSSSVQVQEHRLVMAKHLNRELSPSEIVHHKNGNRTDNRIQNLVLMTRSAHLKHHLQERHHA